MKFINKKIIALLLAATMIFSLSACALEEAGGTSDSPTYSESTSTTDNSSKHTSVTEPTDSSSSSQTTQPNSTTQTTPSADSVGEGKVTKVDPSTLPAFSGKAFTAVNNNQPNFSAAELSTKGYEKYSSLDSRGRCGVAIASCGKEIMPGSNEERGSISSVKPTGWIQKSYSGISGGYLWNRCHLIGWQLSAENANKQNLITGTRFMNINGMLTFENMVADYIKETGNHVAYRITPIFEGNNLVCSGVQMEGYSIEDDGEGICFNVYCYNVQPGILIDYSTGNNSKSNNDIESSLPSTDKNDSNTVQELVDSMVWIPNSGSKYHSNPSCSNMKNPTKATKAEATNRNYTPCKKCY